MAQRKKNSRQAAGTGTIRKKTVTRNGKEYTYWEARYTEGFDPGTGKQVQRSITGKTQKEVAQKLKAATAAIDAGTYAAPSKMTVGQWLDIWSEEYLGSAKPKTVMLYKATISNHLKPAFGRIKLDALDTHTIKKLYNSLRRPREDKPALSPKTIKNIHGIFHKALQQAVKIGYLRFNPADACELPRMEHREIKPLDDETIAAFMKAIRGHRFEVVYLTMLFTGMRRGEACGLTWDCVDLEQGTIRVDKQLQNVPGQPGEFRLISTKNNKGRTIPVALFVTEILKKHKIQQDKLKAEAGPLWQENNFVFCNEVGEHLSPNTVYHNYKRIVKALGLPDARLHDLRHSYAVASLRAGDDIKTVQSNLGHHAAAFTLDVYGHVTADMKRASAKRMENYIEEIKKL